MKNYPVTNETILWVIIISIPSRTNACIYNGMSLLFWTLLSYILWWEQDKPNFFTVLWGSQWQWRGSSWWWREGWQRNTVRRKHEDSEIVRKIPRATSYGKFGFCNGQLNIRSYLDHLIAVGTSNKRSIQRNHPREDLDWAERSTEWGDFATRSFDPRMVELPTAVSLSEMWEKNGGDGCYLLWEITKTR